MEDSYHTMGAIKDRAVAAKREQQRNAELRRIADAVERIAVALEGRGVEHGVEGDPGSPRP